MQTPSKNWFERVEASAIVMKTSSDPAGDIPLRPLLKLCEDALSGYSILYAKGWVSKILQEDFQGNIAKMQRVCVCLEEGRPGAVTQATVGGALTRAAALPNGVHSDEGVWGILWCARTLRFVAELLRALGSDETLSISAAGRATYAKVLSTYHAPVFAFLVGTIVGWAPTRNWVLAHTLEGMVNSDATTACARTAAALAPVPDAIIFALAAANADFPDRISALPFGL